MIQKQVWLPKNMLKYKIWNKIIVENDKNIVKYKISLRFDILKHIAIVKFPIISSD